MADHHREHDATQHESRRTLLRAGIATLAAASGLGTLSACSTRAARRRTLPPLPGEPSVAPIEGFAARRGPFIPSPVGARVIARRGWTSAAPIRSRANVMAPVTHITIHHDGMTPFTATDELSAAGRLDAIQRAHVRRGWADIGYHFAIDPAGRIYEARPLDLQGAHVKHHNRGNIGVLIMGNYEEQRPTAATVAALAAFLADLRAEHRLGPDRVATHREWAATACPGRSLQAEVDRLRSSGWA